jgi:hypothetical protein
MVNGVPRFAFRVGAFSFARSSVREFGGTHSLARRVHASRVGAFATSAFAHACIARPFTGSRCAQQLCVGPRSTDRAPSNELADSAEHAESPPRKPKTRLAECPMRHSPDTTTRLFTDTHLSSQQFIVPATVGQEPPHPRTRNAAANHRTRERANARTNTAV